MTRSNVEIVRECLALLNAQDVDAALGYVAPDAALDWSRSEAPDQGVHVGHDTWRRWMSGRSEALSGARFEEVELIDVPPDRVLLVAYMRGTGRASGLETTGLGAAVIVLHDQRITQITMYQTQAEALAAVGLAE